MLTGSFVKRIQTTKAILRFKSLTCAVLFFLFLNSLALAQLVFNQESTNTYLRWNLFSGRDQLQFSKKGSTVSIKTLNQALYNSLKNELGGLVTDEHYLKEINYKDVEKESNSYVIDVVLLDEKVEMFSFYRERDKKYVVDFWRDGDVATFSATKKVSYKEDKVDLKMAQKETLVPPQVKKRKISSTPELKKEEKKTVEGDEISLEKQSLLDKVKEDKILSNILVDPNRKIEKTAEAIDKENEDTKRPYRDFRYGATLVWDYDPIVPSIKGLMDYKSKLPEMFYPISNRDFKKNESETHLQLTINLYRKKKWGLMYKSIKLYQQKYGAMTNWELIEFIKANAILRENIEHPNPELFKNALSILSNLSDKSEDYELKKAINKYMLAYMVEKGELLKTLQVAKNFYVGSRNNFDFEESAIPAEIMLNSLAKLGQVDKIQELAQEKTMKKILPMQLLLAYQSFAYLRLGQTEAVVSLYEKHKASLIRPIDPVILYNTAESYFRLGKYGEAKKIFEEFANEYSHEFVAANALLRIALCTDFLDVNYDEIERAYKKAIDLSVDSKISYEGRIRYVAFRTVRKKNLTEADRETRIFLEQDKKYIGEIDKNLQRLLQQVRLRTLVVDKKYKDALSYLTLIPMMTMTRIDARAFDGDGAEIVYGILSDFFQKADYAQLIKTWLTYKDKYMDKVAQDPYINFMVGSAYVKLGLYKGFDEIYASFEKVKESQSRTYPVWIDRQENLKASELLIELSLVKDMRLKNWDLASKNVESFEKKFPQSTKSYFYRGIISYNQRDYKNSVKQFEEFFSKNDTRSIHDPSDIAEMIRAYTDSIYELGQTDKFLKVSEAILSDTNSVGTNSAYIQNVRERIAYLAIEISSQKEARENGVLFEKKIEDFKKANPKSIYIGRVNFLLGQSMVQNKKIKEGKEIFKSLIGGKEVSEYIKELAKSELSLINLKERTL